ncbi:leishmanolysin-like peptidase [Dysidea avara]|uniref:leishmanolysin-like peptidase n=1 Tax=Dysidea avara TaxID=196820 RepID=UPI00331DC651
MGSTMLLLCTSLLAGVLIGYGRGEGLSHKCIHDRISKLYPRYPIPHLSDTAGRSKRQTDGFQPFRISVRFVMENITNSSTNLPLLTNPSGAFQQAITYLESVLSVVRAPNNLVVKPMCTTTRNGQCIAYQIPMCGPYATVPAEHLGNITVCDPTCRQVGGAGVGEDADYIYYVSAVDEPDCRRGTLAYASECTYDQMNFRPLTGYTNICPQSLESDNAQYIFMLIVHETLHALGFTNSNYEFFIDEDGNRYDGSTTLRVNGQNVLAINSPKVLSYAREYYSCPNLQGVLLENEGGSGSATSHWEARVISFEVMIAASTESESDYSSISNFTLHYLEDTGWYKVNYAVAESLHFYEFLWGKGLGCDFSTAGCNDYPYSCSPPNADGCSYDYQASSICFDVDFYDGCYIFSPYSNGYCNSPGAPITSSCFPLVTSSNRRGGICYDRQCYRQSSTQGIFYTITRLGDTRLCPSDGTVLTFPLGPVNVTCPPAELVCSRNTPFTQFDATGDVPPSWCDSSCATCSRPVSPAHCLTCSDSMTLRGAAPSLCTSDNCGNGTFLNSMGNCSACASGCRACTGPSNTECLACEDETLYRVTTNQPASMACVAVGECNNPIISTFGDRTCGSTMTSNPGGGGASSTHYHSLQLLVILLMIYALL